MSQAGSFLINGGGGGGSVLTVQGNTGGKVSPDGTGNINIVGTANITVAGNPGTNTEVISITGVIPIVHGGTNTNAFSTTDGTVYFDGTRLATTATGTAGQVLTSAGAGVAPSYQNLPSASITFNGNTGTATGSTINIISSTTEGTPRIVGNNIDTLTLSYSDSQQNVAIGTSALFTALPGFSNIALGTYALTAFTSGDNNTALGSFALGSFQNGAENVSVGSSSMGLNQTGQNNTAVGTTALYQLLSGNSNICIGSTAGFNYTSNETFNICIGSQGITGESHTTRIGVGGAGIDNTACFIGGIDGVNVGSTATVVTEASNQLGTAVITAGTGISVTPGANTITIAATGTTTLSYTAVNHAASPYTVLTTDNYLGADVTGGVITILLPNTTTTGRVFIIKDTVGLAGTSNITVTTVGGVVTIDGGTSFVMNTAYESISVLFNGTNYEVF